MKSLSTARYFNITYFIYPYTNYMKKWSFFRRHWIAITVFALILWAILAKWQPRVDKTPKTSFFYDMEATVQTWTLETILNLQWTTQFSDSQQLTFMTQWKVTAVNVKVWDVVKKNQVLAKISTDDLDNTVAQARLDIENQENTLQDLLDARNLDLEYLQEKANYDALKLQQETIDQDQDLEMQSLLQQIEDAQKSYNDAKADYEELLSWWNSANADLALSSTIRKRYQTIENDVLWLKSIINEVSNYIEEYDKKLIVTDKYKHEVAKNYYIGADDISLVNQSNKIFNQISWELQELIQTYSELNSMEMSNISSEEIAEAYSMVKTIGNDIVDRGEVAYDMFKASITSSSYTLSNIDTDASWAQKLQNTGIGYVKQYTSVIDALANLDDDTSLEDTKLKMDKAKTNLDKLTLQVDVLKTTQAKEKASLQDQINQSLRNIAKIEWWDSLKETQITSARNQLSKLKRNLQNTLDKYEDYQLVANFDWVVTEMDIMVWDNIKNSSNNFDQKYIYVENNNVIEMTFNIEQVDIIQLKVWMEAEVFLDAYPNQTYHGYITEISTIPSTSSTTTTYEMTVTFEKNDPNEMILAWMGWSANISLHKTENVLLVPSQAITTLSGNQVVKLKQWDKRIDQIVEIGDSDETNTEIISWLKAGDIVKSMYVTNEWMMWMWLDLWSQELDMWAMHNQGMSQMMWGGMGGWMWGMGGWMWGMGWNRWWMGWMWRR